MTDINPLSETTVFSDVILELLGEDSHAIGALVCKAWAAGYTNKTTHVRHLVASFSTYSLYKGDIKKRSDLIMYAARYSTDPEVLEDCRDGRTHEHVKAAAAAGNAAAIKCFLRLGPNQCLGQASVYDKELLVAAARHGHHHLFDLLGWRNAKSFPTQSVGWSGSLAAVKWMRDQELLEAGGSMYVAMGAARGGHLHIIEWLADNRYPWNSISFMQHVCTPEVLAFAVAAGLTYSAEAMAHEAARRNSIPMMRYLRDEGVTITIVFMNRAAEYGSRELMCWMKDEIPLEWNATTLAAAVSSNMTETVDMLLEAKCPMDASVTAATVVPHCERPRFHADLLDTLYAAGCPVDGRLIEEAATYGFIDAIKWARARGVAYTPDTMYCALYGAGTGNLDAGRYGNPLNMEIVQYLREDGCPTDSRCFAALVNHESGCLDLAHEIYSLLDEKEEYWDDDTIRTLFMDCESPEVVKVIQFLIDEVGYPFDGDEFERLIAPPEYTELRLEWTRERLHEWWYSDDEPLMEPVEGDDDL